MVGWFCSWASRQAATSTRRVAAVRTGRRMIPLLNPSSLACRNASLWFKVAEEILDGGASQRQGLGRLGRKGILLELHRWSSTNRKRRLLEQRQSGCSLSVNVHSVKKLFRHERNTNENKSVELEVDGRDVEGVAEAHHERQPVGRESAEQAVADVGARKTLHIHDLFEPPILHSHAVDGVFLVRDGFEDQMTRVRSPAGPVLSARSQNPFPRARLEIPDRHGVAVEQVARLDVAAVGRPGWSPQALRAGDLRSLPRLEVVHENCLLRGG